MGWNYRVMRHVEKNWTGYDDEESWVGIHEVYYRNDDVDDLTVTAEETGYTTNPIPARAFDVEDLRERLENMLKALDKPVLEYPEVKKPDEIPAEPAQPPQEVTVHLEWNQHGSPVVEPPFGACITLKVNSAWTYPDGTSAPPDVWISGTADGLRTLAQHILGIAETQSDNYHTHLDKAANEPFFKSPQGWQLTISKHPHG
jgi:hypothetical protein